MAILAQIQPPSDDEPREGRLTRRQRLMQWVEANAKPKVYKFPPRKLKRTRFQKPGPMSHNDWARFNKWYRKQFPAKPPEKPKPSKKKRISGLRRKTLDSRLVRIFRLAEPKHYRDKYQIPDRPAYPFIPTINPKKPAKPEKHRPLQTIVLPTYWYHDELEMNFWSEVRYPIRPKALKYRPSSNIKKLAEPRQYPLPIHCDIPQKNKDQEEDEEEQQKKRKKMTKKQWEQHQIRLEYLSNPFYKENRVLKVLAKWKSAQLEKTKPRRPSPVRLRIRSFEIDEEN